MSWEIFIENNKVDAPENLSAQFTYNIDDIREFGFRNTNFSKTIVLNNTAQNKKVFGHIFEVGSSNFVNPANPNIGYDFNAAKSARCLIFMDGFQVFKGVIRLLEVVIDNGEVEYETAVFGELGGLIAVLADKQLTALDFSAYNHTFNVSNIVSSWSTALGSGYYYPLIDYGYSLNKKWFPIETFRPALHVREYLDKIITGAGYTFESSFLDSNYFKSKIMPFNGQYPGTDVETVVEATCSSFNITFTTSDRRIPLTIAGTNYFYYDSANRQLKWTRGDGITPKFTISLNWSKSGSSPQNLMVGLHNARTNTVEYFHNATLSGTSGTITGEFTLDVVNGDAFTLTCSTTSPFANWTLTSIALDVIGQPTVKIPLAPGDSVVMSQFIPVGITQHDFLKWLIKMYNLYIYEDKERVNHLKIAPYVYFYDTETAENWDSKLDRTKQVRYTSMGEQNSRSYEYKYKDDSDYYNDQYKKKFAESYGSLLYDTGSEFVKDKSTVEVGFSPTPLVQFTNSDRVLSAIYKKTGETTYERVAHNPRILFRKTALTDCQRWYISYYSSGSLAISIQDNGYPYAGHLDDVDLPMNDLNFGTPRELYFNLATGDLSANLYNVFWSFYLSEITDKDSRILKGSFKLSPNDIYNLDFSKPKYINGQLWRLNKVQDYSTSGDEVTKCELIKVIDLE
jgi:hypothetical protein